MSAPYQNRLDAFIKLHDTKIKTLEKITGHGRGAIRRWRLNKVQPDGPTTARLCTFYGITKQELFYFSDDDTDATTRSDSALAGSNDRAATDGEG